MSGAEIQAFWFITNTVIVAVVVGIVVEICNMVSTEKELK